jgi:hypothetical protein
MDSKCRVETSELSVPYQPLIDELKGVSEQWKQLFSIESEATVKELLSSLPPIHDSVQKQNCLVQ